MHDVPGAFQKLKELYAAGEAAVEAGELETAVQRFSEALAIDDHFRQRYVTLYAQRAFALQKLGRLQEAIADYGRALELGEPRENQAQYFFHRAMCWANLPAEGEERRANVERAIADHGASIALYDRHPGPFHLRAKLLVNELERFEEALPDLERALALREVPDLYSTRGFALFNLERVPEALADFERLSSLSEDAYADYMRACCHAKLGDAEAVIERACAALAKDPAYAEYFASDEDFEPYRADPRFAAALKASSEG